MLKLVKYGIKIISLFIACLCLSQLTYASGEQHSNNQYNVAILKKDFMAYEFFRSLESEFGYKFHYQEYEEFNEILSAISTQSSDLAANVVYSEIREKQFQISSPTNIVYLYFFSKNIQFKDTKTIAVPENSIYLDVVKRQHPEMEMIEYSDTAEVLELLNTKKIDGFITYIYSLEAFLGAGLKAELLNDKMPVPPVALIGSFNVDHSEIEKMASFIQSKEQQHKFRQLVDEYQLKYRQKAITQEAINLGIDLSEPIKIKLEEHPPLVYYNDDGKLTGITVDILNQVCELLDANCQIIENENELWQQKYADLKNDKIDLLAPVVISQQRSNYFNFSDIYYTSNVVIVKRYGYQNNSHSDLSELIMERVGSVKDDNFKEILSRALPNKELITYNSIEDKIAGLVNGDVDYILANEFDYHIAMRKSNNTLPIQIDSFFSQTYTAEDAFAFPNTERGEHLAQVFNLALDIINTKPIIADHDVAPDWILILKTQNQSKVMIYIFFTILIILILIFVYFMHRRSVVDELTKLENRRALYAKYGKKGIKPGISLLYLDINSFKIINDSYGHSVGDQVLKMLAQRIKKTWKGNAYRIGGDEFILIGALTGGNEESLVKKITDFSIETGRKELLIDSSFGLYHSATEATDLDDALYKADVAMYENKKRHYDNKKDGTDRRQS